MTPIELGSHLFDLVDASERTIQFFSNKNDILVSIVYYAHRFQDKFSLLF